MCITPGGSTFDLEALMAIAPNKHYVIWDHDAAPVVLNEIQDLRGLAVTTQTRSWESEQQLQLKDASASLKDVRSSTLASCVSAVMNQTQPPPCHGTLRKSSRDSRRYSIMVNALEHLGTRLHDMSWGLELGFGQ